MEKKVDNSVTVKDIVYRDYLRMRNKGAFGLVTSTVLLIGSLYLIEYLGHLVWPKVNEMIDYYHLEKWQFYFFASWTVNISTFLIANLCYSICYTIGHPFFEQYKIIKDEKWPWIEDPKAWNKMFKKTIGVICLNSLVVFPIVVYILVAVVNQFKVKHTFEIKDLPDKQTLIW